MLSSLKSVQKMQESMGLFYMRKQGLEVEDIASIIATLWKNYPRAGVWEVMNILFHEYHLCVAQWQGSFLVSLGNWLKGY